jgi:hypothetical protein
MGFEGYKQRVVTLWLLVFAIVMCMFITYKFTYMGVDETMGYGYSYMVTVVFASLTLAVGVLGSVAFYLEGEDIL